MNVLESCPFCGSELDINDPENLHRSGTYWRERENGFRQYVPHKERIDTDNPCWVVSCEVTYGGCGVTMHGDSREEAIAKWNRRKSSDKQVSYEEYKVILQKPESTDQFDWQTYFDRKKEMQSWISEQKWDHWGILADGADGFWFMIKENYEDFKKHFGVNK